MAQKYSAYTLAVEFENNMVSAPLQDIVRKIVEKAAVEIRVKSGFMVSHDVLKVSFTEWTEAGDVVHDLTALAEKYEVDPD